MGLVRPTGRGSPCFAGKVMSMGQLVDEVLHAAGDMSSDMTWCGCGRVGDMQTHHLPRCSASGQAGRQAGRQAVSCAECCALLGSVTAALPSFYSTNNTNNTHTHTHTHHPALLRTQVQQARAAVRGVCRIRALHAGRLLPWLLGHLGAAGKAP